jgi:hypothetical protein
MQTLLLLVTSSLVIVGIVAYYLHLAGFSRRGQIPNSPAGIKEAKHKIQAAYPTSTITDFKITPNHSVALALFKDGTGGFLHAVGRNWAFHLLNTNSVKRITVITNPNKVSGLHISFNDYTAPKLKILLENETMSKSWLAALQPFVQSTVKKG